LNYPAKRDLGDRAVPRMIAQAEGKKYYIGKPCKWCGSPERRTSNGHCVDDQNHYRKIWKEREKQ
jgi:hypothetical protein